MACTISQGFQGIQGRKAKTQTRNQMHRIICLFIHSLLHSRDDYRAIDWLSGTIYIRLSVLCKGKDWKFTKLLVMKTGSVSKWNPFVAAPSVCNLIRNWKDSFLISLSFPRCLLSPLPGNLEICREGRICWQEIVSFQKEVKWTQLCSVNETLGKLYAQGNAAGGGFH
jgi:hypothetical protein